MNTSEGQAPAPAGAPAPAVGPPRAHAATRRRGTRLDLRNLSLLIVLAALVLVGALTTPEQFLSLQNLQLVLTQASVIGVVTVGVTFVIIGGGIDLSVGAIVALATVWATTVATQQYGLGGILLSALLVGLGRGLVNG
ncbi:ABC transporter permease, partial [Streptomyces decoyicus]